MQKIVRITLINLSLFERHSQTRRCLCKVLEILVVKTKCKKGFILYIYQLRSVSHRSTFTDYFEATRIIIIKMSRDGSREGLGGARPLLSQEKYKIMICSCPQHRSNNLTIYCLAHSMPSPVEKSWIRPCRRMGQPKNIYTNMLKRTSFVCVCVWGGFNLPITVDHYFRSRPDFLSPHAQCYCKKL